MENDQDKLRLKLAKVRMKEIKAFYIMLTGCAILIPYLIFLGYSIYLFAGKDWEEKKVKQIMNNQKSI